MTLLITAAQAMQTRALKRVSTQLVEQLIHAASSLAEKYCDTSFTSAERTEVSDGNGLSWTTVRNIPITALGDIVITDGGGTENTLASSNFDFDAENGRIAFAPDNTSSFAWFIRGFQNISITYTAGYAEDSMPYEVQQAITMLVVNMYMQSSMSNPEFQPERMGEEQHQLFPRSSITMVGVLTLPITELLDPYRRLTAV